MSPLGSLLRRFLSAKREPPQRDKEASRPVHKSLQNNLDYSIAALGGAGDFIHRRFVTGKRGEVEAALLFLQGLTDYGTVQNNILQPLQMYSGSVSSAKCLAAQAISACETSITQNLSQAIDWVLQGMTVFLLDGSTEAVAIDARGVPGRQVEEPTAEKTVAGPREGFTESLERNLALIRKRLPSTRLKTIAMKLGTITKTTVTVCYLQGHVETPVLEEVLQRLEHLKHNDLPDILDSTYVAEAIEDHPLSPFPQTAYTERPDRTVASLIDGKVCIIVDGTPSVAIMPASLPDVFQSPEDYYQRYLPATVSRWLRYLAAFLGTSASALYVAVVTYHYEVIPQRLIVSVARARAMTPFGALFEALVLEGAVEMLREATTRLPTTVGQVIGVVGALVLGQAAVQANLVSPLLVIVVAVSTIASFAIPNNPAATALRLMRFPLILAAGFL